MNTKTFKLIELFALFVVIPVSFAIVYPIWLKMTMGLLGFIYVLFILLKVENNKFKIAPNLNWKKFWWHTFLKLVIIAIATIAFVWFTDKSQLFFVLYNKPKLWIFILFLYSLFSVYPQELIYRTLYFQRYKSLFKSQSLFMFMNAILFSLAHLFF
ncbi:CPBP family intramembrane glutamate endopeptidase, partial [Yeosuana sp.]|uniref:CPBP family intramembrane glutamate endopeptidase n=1 Tax=Yeosuana sp. TaxID=2529388 RepID=UPI00405529A1